MYAGTLTAVLAIPAFEQPVDSLTDLPYASLDGFTVGTLKDSSTEFLFRVCCLEKEKFTHTPWISLLFHCNTAQRQTFPTYLTQGRNPILSDLP